LKVVKASSTTGVATPVITDGPVLMTWIKKLVYDDRNNLHVIQNREVSLRPVDKHTCPSLHGSNKGSGF
jgi:hypothetical protein